MRRGLVFICLLGLGCGEVRLPEVVDAGTPLAAVAPVAPVAPPATPAPVSWAPEPTLAEDPAVEAEPPAEASQATASDLDTPSEDTPSDEEPPEDEGPEDEAPEELAFDPGGQSLRVLRSITVRAAPRDDAQPIGTLAQDMRVAWVRAVKGPGCDAWVEIEPRGFICERYLEGNFRAPRTRELPIVAADTLTPGVYARVVGRRARAYPNPASAWRRLNGHRLKGALTLRLVSKARIRGHIFWRTSEGEYVEARFLRRYHPSKFEGVGSDALGELELPIAWAQSRVDPKRPVVLRKEPSSDARRAGKLSPRTRVTLRELSTDGLWAQVAPGKWAALDDLHVARRTPLPDALGADERWVDVDLHEQVLVAYQGPHPAYATLISSGAATHPTPEGLFRIWIKFAEVDMKGQEPTGKSYKVATVPWVMFFEGDFALHSAYWHDHFGAPASHGCVNLSPRDARFLYGWTRPEVPDGWSMAYASSTLTGTLVRIHQQPFAPQAPLTVCISSDSLEHARKQ